MNTKLNLHLHNTSIYIPNDIRSDLNKISLYLNKLGYHVHLVKNQKHYFLKFFRTIYDEEDIYILDNNFKEKFMIVRPSYRYTNYIYPIIPEIFIGTKNDLIKSIKYLVLEMSKSFSENNLYYPFFRTEHYVKKYWNI